MGEQWEDVMQDVSGAAFPSPSLDTFPDLRPSYRPWDPHSSRPTEPTFQPQSADVPELPTHGPYLFEPKTVGDHWEQLHQAVENYDHEMCTSWREEIDTLLVFVRISPHSLPNLTTSEGRLVYRHCDCFHGRVVQVATARTCERNQSTPFDIGQAGHGNIPPLALRSIPTIYTFTRSSSH